MLIVQAAYGTAGGEGAGVWHERRRTAGGSGIVFRPVKRCQHNF